MAKSGSKRSTSSVVSALEYLSQPDKFEAVGVCAVFGDEAYLKSEVLATLRRHVLRGEEDAFSLTTFTGKEAQLREVVDALATVSLFGSGPRLVIVEDADSFVTEHRAELEEYVSRPAKGGVLVLDVKTWPGNTRLAKAVAETGLTIECKPPAERQLKSWLIQRAKAIYDVKLEAAATDALLELVPPEIGVLVQEVAKLALSTGENRVIDVALVREHVGGWRTRTAWDMIDAIADGRAADAISQLGRLLAAGEKPQGVFPMMASSLRKFALAVDLLEEAEGRQQRLPLRNALAQAGVLPFKLDNAERQLRQIGRERAKRLTRWLLATDLAIKGYNSSDDAARMELERLIVRLAATNETATV